MKRISTGGNEFLMRLLSISILLFATFLYFTRKFILLIFFPLYIFSQKRQNAKKRKIIEKFKVSDFAPSSYFL